MKTIHYIVVFAGFAAAVPQNAIDALIKRAPGSQCGGFSGKTCAESEVCIGEEELRDGIGVCVKSPQPCGNAQGDKCPEGEWSCFLDPRIDCSSPDRPFEPGAPVCGDGICLSGRDVKKAGLQTDYPKRCGGISDKECAEDELCIGDNVLLDEIGVCVKKLRSCGNFLGMTCPGKNYECVSDPRDSIDCKPGVQDCGGGLCLLKAYGDKIGRRDPSAPLKDPKRCGGSSGKKCGKYEVCAGEEVLKDGMGVCIGIVMNCGNDVGDRCFGSEYLCVNDPRTGCKPGQPCNANGVCMFKEYGERFGLKTIDDEFPRCGGISGKTCAEDEICVGEGDTKDGMGICVKDLPSCSSPSVKPCPPVKRPGRDHVCVKASKGSGVCLLKEHADWFGLKEYKGGDVVSGTTTAKLTTTTKTTQTPLSKTTTTKSTGTSSPSKTTTTKCIKTAPSKTSTKSTKRPPSKTTTTKPTKAPPPKTAPKATNKYPSKPPAQSEYRLKPMGYYRILRI
ncbi:hypothetical protein TWF569_006649 [Orbilia oligospora]|uniref:Uncharacterized protein n=1 Tax=Orbilia oligospora TaxID=2813651 RepID=A0A7C8J7N6_ORBOL|nr:hypothetical protein TWF102_005309 [Orbilia oligospora]KAF3101903.1 hypothetical protein TWF103_007885 [Orbilia oligospora]KAF3111673.1 hypothetical protein TWF706_011416 [Orbilia oligospora]KAF3133669.1 hypothetical protein TWF703_006726 [Orbilia oligospora]KAF3140025.1 hypothetical protein TWF594_006420 [Orbilia oligospora]